MDGDRCGYTHHASRYPKRGAVTCWRPTYEGADRCVWHLDEAAKPPGALSEARPEAGERLDGAVLRGVALQGTDLLAGAVLIDADFGGANLADADLGGADLRAAEFADARARRTDFDGANLEDASFERTKLQGATFLGAHLEDAELSNAGIDRNTSFDAIVSYERAFRETDDPDRREVLFDGATWVYRQIQRVSRRNALFHTAEVYFYREKDLRRRLAWLREDYPRAALSEASRWVMGYGRNPWRVLLTSAFVVVLSALLFPFVGGLLDTTTQPSTRYSLAFPPGQSAAEVVDVLGTSLYFSVVTFGTLGYGDVEPVGTAARALAAIETLVGFALIGLLISVLIRRGSWL